MVKYSHALYSGPHIQWHLNPEVNHRAFSYAKPTLPLRFSLLLGWSESGRETFVIQMSILGNIAFTRHLHYKQNWSKKHSRGGEPKPLNGFSPSALQVSAFRFASRVQKLSHSWQSESELDPECGKTRDTLGHSRRAAVVREDSRFVCPTFCRWGHHATGCKTLELALVTASLLARIFATANLRSFMED